MNALALSSGLREIRREWKTARGLPSIGRRLYPKGVAFVHVPKCAGRSVEQGLRRAYRFSRGHVHAGVTFDHALSEFGTEIRSQNDRHAVLTAATAMRASTYAYNLALGVRCVTGHAPANEGLLRTYGDRYAFVTVLRDPVERFKSHFLYSYKSGGHGNIELDLPEFLETERARTFGSMYLKYFAYGMAPLRDNKSDMTVAVTSARACLERFAVVGFVDDMPRFESGVCDVLSRKIRFGHVNSGSRRPSTPYRKTDIPPELEERIAKLCAPDREIYDWARSRFGVDR